MYQRKITLELGEIPLINAGKTILVVEGSDDDYEVLARALSVYGKEISSLYRCEDGQKALDYLHRQGAFHDPSDAVRPTLILLDLNIPMIDGHRVLAEVKGDTALKSIPVIIMTTSNDERDIETCYRMGANTCVQKPNTSSDFNEVIKRVTEFWLRYATLPGSERNP